MPEGTSSAAKPAAPDANGSTQGKSAKELPAGDWRGQILKYESVIIGGEKRRFPQDLLSGSRDDSGSGPERVGLHEVVQCRFFNRARQPNPLSAARKKAKAVSTALTLNDDNQLEAKPDAPWHPKGTLAFLDCLESIRFLLILVAYGTESAIDRYFDWWDKQVRARPQRLEQLRMYRDMTAWRIAFQLRSHVDFGAMVSQIIEERQWKADKAW
eukprot:s2038_g4.t1